jgi:hypothetical protein
MPRESTGKLIRPHDLTRSRNGLAGVLLTGLAVSAFAQAGPLPASSSSGRFATELSDANLPDAPESQVADRQIATGSIQGVVSNQDGAVYEGVHITLAKPGADPAIQAPERSAVTDSNGHFFFADVPAGPFLLTVTSEGFATQRVSGVLKPDETYQAPAIVLPVSTATSEISVNASRLEIAQEELHLEEEQRVLGFIPNFYVVYDANAPALTPRQKFHLAWKSSLDPVNFLITGAVAGVQQADDTFSGYGQGASGYSKRYGANFADGFIGDMLSGAVLPALFKQDPRYFYKGKGPIRSRALYAMAAAVICKGDNGHWQFDYSGILGSLAAGGISNLYYPAKDRNGIGLTFEGAAYGIAGNAVGNLFQEFLVRKLLLKGSKRTSSQP